MVFRKMNIKFGGHYREVKLFAIVSGSTFGGSTLVCCMFLYFISNCQHLLRCISDLITEDEFTRAGGILKQYSYKWRAIGQALGFKASKLDSIASRPLLLLDAPNSYLSAMLSEWQLWAPGDHRGSRTYATLHSLKTAVDRAGLGLTAQELV